MTLEVQHATLYITFHKDFTLSPELNEKEALNAILLAIKNGQAKEVNVGVDYLVDKTEDKQSRRVKREYIERN